MVGVTHIVLFSGGHSSAIAAVEVVRRFGARNTVLLNHDLCDRAEHPDTKRFKQEVADRLGVPITYANAPGFANTDQFDVCVKAACFHAGTPGTELCTNRLKTKPFRLWLRENYPADADSTRPDVIFAYGFDPTEQSRISRRMRIMLDMGYLTEYPLTWNPRTIQNIEELGIARPAVYDIFNHANCIGCLKAGKQHWFVVYCLYPSVWEKAKAAEQAIGYSILKTAFLRDLESEFEMLRERALPPTEKIKPQRFWAAARKLVRDDQPTAGQCPAAAAKETHTDSAADPSAKIPAASDN